MSRIVGVLNKDSNMNEIQRARGLSTLDGTTSPQQSPLTIASGSETVIVAPACAVGIFIYTDHDLWIDSVTGVSTSKGFLLVAGSYMQMDLEAGRALYCKAASTSAIVSYMFQTIPIT